MRGRGAPAFRTPVPRFVMIRLRSGGKEAAWPTATRSPTTARARPSRSRSNTAASQPGPCGSSITFLDGDNGILRYRGYPIQELAEQSTYLEVAYLLVHGELPSRAEF